MRFARCICQSFLNNQNSKHKMNHVTLRAFLLLLSSTFLISASYKLKTPDQQSSKTPKEKTITENPAKEENKLKTNLWLDFIKNLKLGETLNGGWLVSEISYNQNNNPAIITLKGDLETRVNYYNFVDAEWKNTKEENNSLEIYFDQKSQKQLPTYNLANTKVDLKRSKITDEGFTYKIADNSYGTMNVTINKIFLVGNFYGDTLFNTLYISRVSNINEEGRINYEETKNDKHYAQQREIVKNFLKSDIINRKVSDDYLHKAIKNKDTEFAESLINDNQINLEERNEMQQTPLHLAIENKEEKIVSLLLEKGADINATDKYKNSILHIAVKSNQPQIVKKLLESKPQINISEKNIYDKTPIFYAKNNEIIKLLLEHNASLTNIENNKIFELLLIAVKNSDEDLVNYLIKNGVNINIEKTTPESSSQTVLFEIEIPYEKSYLQQLSSFKFVQFLLNKGLEINAQDYEGNTVLHKVVKQGLRKEVEHYVKFLLSQQANPNIQNNSGETPLHIAASLFSDNENTKENNIRLLLDYGADFNLTNSENKTALKLAEDSLASSDIEIEEKLQAINMLKKAAAKKKYWFF